MEEVAKTPEELMKWNWAYVLEIFENTGHKIWCEILGGMVVVS